MLLPSNGIFPLFVLFVLGVIGYYYYVKVQTNQFVANENEFSQAGVKVLFQERKITIQNKEYQVNQIKSIEKVHKGNFCHILIRTDDFQSPLHTVRITGYVGGEEFFQRLQNALNKAKAVA